jgi:hypothetical protein
MNLPKKCRSPMIGVRSSSSLSVVPRQVKTKSLFVSRFSQEVTTTDNERSLNEQLKLKSLSRARLKTEFNSYASFHISVAEDDFHLINNTGVWPSGCLIAPYYGRLSPDHTYSYPTLDSSHPPSPPAGASPVNGTVAFYCPEEVGAAALS